MSKQALILSALQGSTEVWTELKRDWFKNKLPGTPYTPGEFMIRLLIGRLALTTDDIYEALQKADDLSIEGLKKDGILSGACRLNEDSVKILMATLLDVPEIAEAEYKPEPEQPIEQSNVSEFVSKPEPLAQESKVTECPYCAHDFERCENGFYETAEVETVQASTVPQVVVSDAVGCEHVDSKNKCTDCTEEDTRDCSNCGETCIEAKLVKCKDFESCENAYCSKCTEEYIGQTGFCDDCNTITCDGCSSEIDNGTQKQCKNSECESKEDYCVDCALALLNKKGLCSSCSGEEIHSCDGECQSDFIESLLIKCKAFDDCSHEYCTTDAKESLNAQGYCDECSTVECGSCSSEIDRGSEKKCKKGDDCAWGGVLCDDCASRLLNKSKLCCSCSGEEELTCDGDCGEDYTDSNMRRCKGCANVYCKVDAKNELNNRGRCSDCAEPDQ